MRFIPAFALLASVAVAPCFAQQPVLLDNEWVKIVYATNVPGQKSRLHRHVVDRLMVHLDAGRLRLTDEGGAYNDAVFGDREARWDPAGGLHTSENIGGNSIRIVEVEFKRPGKPSAVKTGASAAGGSAAAVEFDRPQARVLRLRLAPGQTVALDSRPEPALVVGLADGRLEFGGPGGTKGVEARLGGVSFEDGGAASVRNTGAAPVEFLYVELR